MTTLHEHAFAWNDDEAFYMCRCGAIEAVCWGCRKHSGKAAQMLDGVRQLHFCSTPCRGKYDALAGTGPDLGIRV